MVVEGMVHALHRAHALLAPGGCLIDLRPTAETARLEAIGLAVGLLDADAADRRHAAAEAALTFVVAQGLFQVDAEHGFCSPPSGDWAEAWRDPVHPPWRDPRMGDPLAARATPTRRAHPALALRIAEQLRI